MLPNDKAVYSDDFYEDTESYTQRPISRQTQPTLEIDFYLHRLWPRSFTARRGCRAGAGNPVLSRNSASWRANHSIGLACCLTSARTTRPEGTAPCPT